VRSSENHKKGLKDQGFFKENVRHPVWTCRDPISLILGTRFSILGTRLKKPWKDNYGLLIDFLSQISKLSISLLDLADFVMQHCFPFLFLMWQPWVCANTAANLCLQYVYHFELDH